MVTWLGVVEGLAVLITALLLALLALALRRRWLARQGGTFECSVRLRVSTPGAGWALGVARYNGEMLEWFRFFSYAWKPRVSFRRTETRVLDSREPSPVEAVSLYAGQRIVRLSARPDGVRLSGRREDDRREWELAMSPDSLTGLMSWLEAAPPGIEVAY